MKLPEASSLLLDGVGCVFWLRLLAGNCAKLTPAPSVRKLIGCDEDDDDDVLRNGLRGPNMGLLSVPKPGC